jgi:protein-tyrosine phosphatase-like protein
MFMTVQTDSPPAADPLPETLRHVPALLGAEFGGTVHGELVERTVTETYRELAADARVSSFLPILTEKVARDRLASLAGRRVRPDADRLSTATA